MNILASISLLLDIYFLLFFFRYSANISSVLIAFKLLSIPANQIRGVVQINILNVFTFKFGIFMNELFET